MPQKQEDQVGVCQTAVYKSIYNSATTSHRQIPKNGNRGVWIGEGTAHDTTHITFTTIFYIMAWACMASNETQFPCIYGLC